MEDLLREVAADIVASVIAAPILFIAGFYARPLWHQMLGHTEGEDSEQLQISELVYLVFLSSILGGIALVSAYLALNWLHVPDIDHVSLYAILLSFGFYLLFSIVINFLGVNILSSMKRTAGRDVSVNSPADKRGRVFSATTMAKFSVAVLMGAWALWASPPHRVEPFLIGLFFLFFIDVIGAIVMLLTD